MEETLELIGANTRLRPGRCPCAGRRGGRKPRLNAEQIAMVRKLYDEGAHTVARTAARIIGAPRSTVYLDTTGTPPAETA